MAINMMLNLNIRCLPVETNPEHAVGVIPKTPAVFSTAPRSPMFGLGKF